MTVTTSMGSEETDMPATTSAFDAFPVAATIRPMEAKLVDTLPVEEEWQFEPKWDGFRCLAFKTGKDVALHAKSGKPLHRYFPEMADLVAGLDADAFVLDGELEIPQGNTLSYDALPMRLHPAETRIRRLAAETPAVLIVFDLLRGPGGANLLAEPLRVRRGALEAFVSANPHPRLRLSPVTRDRSEACGWLERTGAAIDGVIAKQLDRAYECGERAMLKVKRIRTADCVVGGFRYLEKKPLVGSLLLGLFDEAGLLHHVGFTSMISNAEREDLTRRLEALAGGEGFTGRAPGGPSRWSTERSTEWTPLRHELVVEVAYDQVTGDRLRHGSRLERWRPDKAPAQCTFEQIAPPATVDPLLAAVTQGV